MPVRNEARATTPSLTHRAMSGMRFGDWLRLVRESGGRIHRSYWSRLLFLSFQSFLNEFIYLEEERQLSTLIDEQQPSAPIFVLGFWRSGTTFLHQLLCLDSRFSFPTVLQVHNPHTFFFIEGRLQSLTARMGRRLYLAWVKHFWGNAPISWVRVQDRVRSGHAFPEEDEIAMLMMKQSYDLDPMFSVLYDRYGRYLALRELEPKQLARWKTSWLRFVKKLTLRNHGSTLVLKSPSHTARVRYILELFPGAKFVHIHRHPFELFQSFKRHTGLRAVTPPYFEPTNGVSEAEFIAYFRTVYSAYLEDRELIPNGQSYEMSYHDLCADPVTSVEQTYSALEFPPFENVSDALEREIELRRGYQRNEYDPLPLEQKQRLHKALGRYFEEFGYTP